MVAIHFSLVLSAIAGVVSAGKCKPESSASKSLSFSQSTTETTLVESTAAATTLITSATSADVTTETSATEAGDKTSTEVTSDTTSAAIIESSLTTFVTSFATSNAETTTSEVATTTTAAAPAAATCPSSVQQCAGTISIRCDTVLVGLSKSTKVDSLQACVASCNADTSCAGFTYLDNRGLCFLTGSTVPSTSFTGWASGFKGTC